MNIEVLLKKKGLTKTAFADLLGVCLLYTSDAADE